MKIKMFSVFDSAIGAYMTPFFSQSQGAAIRSLGDAANDPSHPFHKHSLDFTLFELGEFDDNSGEFVATPPIRIIACVELVLKDVSPK